MKNYLQQRIDNLEEEILIAESKLKQNIKNIDQKEIFDEITRKLISSNSITSSVEILQSGFLQKLLSGQGLASYSKINKFLKLYPALKSLT